MKGTMPVERGSGNVFADLGLANPEERLAKAQLSRLIAKEVERRGLTQARAAEVLGCAQPDVSNIVRGNVGRFSIERLARFLTVFGNDVEIRVSPATEEEGRFVVHV